MMTRINKVLFGVPSITLVGIAATYLVLGFLVLPALVKWQLEQQLADRGHVLRVEAVRFDPLALRFEVDRLALTDAQGQPMFAFDELVVDLEWRSIRDGAWTFADARLRGPVLHFDLAKDGRHNFSDLIDRFASAEPQQPSKGGLPPLRVERLLVFEGRVDYSDQMLEQPLVTRVSAWKLDAQDVSTLRDQLTGFHLSLLTEAGETVQASGQLGVDPLLARGELALDKIQVASLVRALSRQLALQGAGSITLHAGFDLALDAQAALTGHVRGIDFGVDGLSLQASGAAEPLLAANTVALSGGEVDLAQRDIRFARFQLARGGVALALDAQGRGQWSGMVRGAARTDSAATSAAPSGKPSAEAGGTPNAAPWRVALDDARVDAMAFNFNDAAHRRAVALAALNLGVVPSMAIGAGTLRVELGKLQLSAAGLLVDDGADSVSIPSTQIDIGKVVLGIAGNKVDGTVESPRLVLAQGLSARQGDKGSATLGATTLATGTVSVTSGDGSMRSAVDAPRLQVQSMKATQSASQTSAETGELAVQGDRMTLQSGGEQASQRLRVDAPSLRLQSLAAAQAQQSARFEALTLRGALLTLESATSGNTIALDAAALDLRALQLADQDQQFTIAGLQLDNKSLSGQQGDSGLQLQLQEPVLQLTDVRAQRGQEGARLAQLRLQGTEMKLASQAATTAVSLAGLIANGTALALERASDSLDLAELALGSESLSLNLEGAGARVAGAKASASVSGVQARQGANNVALKNAALLVGAFDATSAAAGSGSATAAQLQTAALTLDSLVLNADADQAGLASLAGAELSAVDLALAMPEGAVDLSGKAIDLSLTGAVLRDPKDAAVTLLQLDRAAVSGASLSSADRRVTLDRLVLDQARALLWIDDQGELNLIERFAPGSAAAPGDAPGAAGKQPAPDATAPASEPWRLVVNDAELTNTAVSFENRRRSPPVPLSLVGIGARISALDTGASAPMQFEARASLQSGGTLEAKGALAQLGSAADLQITAKGIALAPAQAYLREYLQLDLASGSASTSGRLLFGEIADNKARLSYAGGFSVDQLLLEEIAPKRPFLAWEAVRTGDLSLTLEPDRLDIGELQVLKPVGRLIIAQDQSINLTDVFKQPEPATGEKPALAKGQPADGAALDVFPVMIAQVRVSDGQLEFADLSQRPQFGARMHQLKGVITGLGTDANSSAKVQLDARVDKFGSARIRGQASVFQPAKLTEIEMAFRNLEMTSLSPYVVKFAGYEIASGKLSLDLQYKVRDGKLLGGNKVVLNQLELGQKVDSPGALDLPLELALAILKDSKGVIDIGLPVRGDLNDPEFDYGAVITKAIGNLLGGIVTAPFRALAALFGGGDTNIDSIAFEPGDDRLAPPEQQKLETVAHALNERPNLLLKVDPVYATEQDTPAIQSLMVRSEIARRVGLEVPQGEDPGPIDAANPRVPAAVEAAFSARYAPQVLAVLKQRALQDMGVPAPPAADAAAAAGANAAAPASASASATATAGAAAAGTTSAAASASPAVAPPPAFYQGLIDRMVKEQPVSDEMLRQLAARRADAIVLELTGENGVAPDRVKRGEPRKAVDASDTVVALKLQLEVTK